MLWVLTCTVHLTVCSYHVTYMFQSESTLYSCLNVNELLSRSRQGIWSFSDCNRTQTPNHLVHKRTLNHLAKLAKHDMIRAYSQMHHTGKYSQHSSIIWPVQLNSWVFVYELSGGGLESSCSHLNFRLRACFKQEVIWHSGNYRDWIHSETRTWHDKNIQLRNWMLEQPVNNKGCWSIQFFLRKFY